MDPNALLKDMLEVANDILNGHGEIADAVELAQKIIDLHTWIIKGGFLPKSWTPSSVKKPRNKYTHKRPMLVEAYGTIILSDSTVVKMEGDTFSIGSACGQGVDSLPHWIANRTITSIEPSIDQNGEAHSYVCCIDTGNSVIQCTPRRFSNPADLDLYLRSF